MRKLRIISAVLRDAIVNALVILIPKGISILVNKVMKR